MSEEKTFKIIDGDISDGYHTFDELHEHRITIYIALCKQQKGLYDMAEKAGVETPRNVWRSKKHSDDSEWDGWFIMGIGKLEGNQITYHLPDKKWDECDFAETLDKAPKFDGHTSADVLERIKNL